MQMSAKTLSQHIVEYDRTLLAPGGPMVMFLCSLVVLGAVLYHVLHHQGVDATTVEHSTSTLKESLDDEEAVHASVDRLSSYASGPKRARVQQALVADGGVELLVEAMTMHTGSAKVVVKCLALLTSLCGAPGMKQRLRQCKLWPVIVSVVNKHLDSLEDEQDFTGSKVDSAISHALVVADLIRQAEVLVGTLVDGDSALQTAAVSAGVHLAVLDAMQQFPKHTELQKWAMWCLLNLSYEHSANKLELVMRAGAFKQVLSSMKPHLEAVDIQRLGLGFLYSALQQPEADSDGGGGNVTGVRAMRGPVLTTDIAEAVQRAMETHPDAADVQEMAGQLLRLTNSAKSDGSQMRLRRKQRDEGEDDEQDSDEEGEVVDDREQHADMRGISPCDNSKPLSPIRAF